ncbi:Fasciclin-like arabinogalactan protein [Quillaja saponaria]|uniref:Fasciclin-like arabinogalactan protein n=1 Tax=Quillaja saponaria TaxID=32244 RepID=A0AAD7Q069_QUISA|nr:Fasciclin-like arabinogalactan protein [Quillaja saponaria]
MAKQHSLTLFLPLLLFFLHCISFAQAQAQAPAPSGPTNITKVLEKAGTLNTLNSQQQLQLIQFHILPALYTLSQFQTASNPLSTQAGNSGDGQYPLNVTTSGNQVNITTGVVNATVANTIYSDSQLAVYQVDQVLLPLALFGSPAAPAPAPSKPEKSVRAADSPSGSSDPSVDSSGVMSLKNKPVAVITIIYAVMAAICLLI